MEITVFCNFISEMTYCFLCHMPLVTKTNPGTIEGATTQGENKRQGSLGAILKADLHKTETWGQETVL